MANFPQVVSEVVGETRAASKAAGLINAESFVVIDLETTGLSSRSRAVEVACRVFDMCGRQIKQYESLIDPGCNLGAKQIHGISADLLCQAPHFGEIAADVMQILEGSVVVAHHLCFDWSVLCAEFRRLGASLDRSYRGICTARLCREVFGTTLSLSEVCRRLKISFGHPHVAMRDVEATAAVFQAFCGQLANLPPYAPVPRLQRGWTLQRSKAGWTREMAVADLALIKGSHV